MHQNMQEKNTRFSKIVLPLHPTKKIASTSPKMFTTPSKKFAHPSPKKVCYPTLNFFYYPTHQIILPLHIQKNSPFYLPKYLALPSFQNFSPFLKTFAILLPPKIWHHTHGLFFATHCQNISPCYPQVFCHATPQKILPSYLLECFLPSHLKTFCHYSTTAAPSLQHYILGSVSTFMDDLSALKKCQKQSIKIGFNIQT